MITVALDSAGATAAGEWIRAAQPTHPALIDAHYDLATRYHLVNVPSAVWIDESGRIVRPAEVAFADNRFIAYTKFDMTRYLDAIRDWVRAGDRSEHAFTAEQARAHLPAVTADVVTAQAMFRLGQFLLAHGESAEGQRWIREASRLQPDSWCIWRQGAGVNETGLAALPDFWERVDALGAARYYAPVDMKGMP